MAGKDLGTKHVCFKCGTKFYDFKKPEPLCPKCGADQRQNPAAKGPAERRQKAPPRPPPREEVEAESEEELDEAEVDGELEDEDDADEGDEG